MPRKAATQAVDAPAETSLDEQQTKLHHPREETRAAPVLCSPPREESPDYDFYSYAPPPASPAETAFRHRSWMAVRRRIRAALARSGIPAARIDRFDQCGADCVVEVRSDGQAARCRAFYCGDRFCTPCSNARAIQITDRLTAWMDSGRWSFTTLTLKADGFGLAVRLTFLLVSFARLRRLSLWTSQVTCGCYCVQITRGKAGTHWHVHLHCLHDGPPFDRNALSDAWKSVTVGSFIVDSRAVADSAHAARYVARYATRGIENDVTLDPAALDECMSALRGRRMLGTFGAWRGRDMEREDDDQHEWRPVGRVDRIVAAASRGEPWALGVLKLLNVVMSHEGTGVRFSDAPRDARAAGIPRAEPDS